MQPPPRGGACRARASVIEHINGNDRSADFDGGVQGRIVCETQILPEPEKSREVLHDLALFYGWTMANQGGKV